MPAAVIANVHRPKNKRAFRVGDFMPKEPRQQTAQEQIDILKALTKHG